MWVSFVIERKQGKSTGLPFFYRVANNNNA